jgi:hypothetical protein
MSRRDSTNGFETGLTRSLGATRRGFAFMSLIISVPFTRLRAGYSGAGEFILMIKQLASWCVTVGSGPVCDEKRAT